jgi:hypothetical protein
MRTAVSALESTEFYPLNLDRAPECLVFISDTRETINLYGNTASKRGSALLQKPHVRMPYLRLNTVDSSWFSDDLPDEIAPSKLLN